MSEIRVCLPHLCNWLHFRFDQNIERWTHNVQCWDAEADIKHRIKSHFKMSLSPASNDRIWLLLHERFFVVRSRFCDLTPYFLASFSLCVFYLKQKHKSFCGYVDAVHTEIYTFAHTNTHTYLAWFCFWFGFSFRFIRISTDHCAIKRNLKLFPIPFAAAAAEKKTKPTTNWKINWTSD